MRKNRESVLRTKCTTSGRHLLAAMLVVASLFFTQNALEASSSTMPLIDACIINPVFCGTDGTTDLPDFISGFAAFDSAPDGTSTLTVEVHGSLPNESHSVHLCPGSLSNTNGFTGCRTIGFFMTDIYGDGSFSMVFPDGTPAEEVVAINVPVFSTVLANCPAQPNADCEPAPTQCDCPCVSENDLFRDFVENQLDILAVVECRDDLDMAGALYVLTNGTTVGAASGTRGNRPNQCGTQNLVSGATDFIPITPQEDEACRELLRAACPL